MSDEAKPVVIVGAGQSGCWVAMTIRQHQPDRPIILLGDESHPPYERPPLSKDVLSGKSAPESTYIRPETWYRENGIDLRLGTQVRAIRRKEKSVELDSGEVFPYDRLVIATGMRPRRLAVPGADHPAVHTLRAMADLGPVRSALEPGRRVVCIGAGFIGLEIASVAARAGCEVTVIEAAPRALGRVVAPEVAAAIVRRHERHGVRFLFDASVTAIKDRGEGGGTLQLADRTEVMADLILVGVGGEPNDELAREAGLDCQGGIRVDATGRTLDPFIYAAGDVTRQHNLGLGREVRLESWQNAQNQGIAVGREVAGVPEPYAEVPWFWTDQYDDNFQIVGAPESWDRILWRGSPQDDSFTAIYLSGGRVVGGNALNNGRDIRPLRQMIADRAEIDEVLLADMSQSLIKIQKAQVAR